MSSFADLLPRVRHSVDEEFRRFLQSAKWASPYPELSSHALVGAGKAFRPALLWSFYQDFSEDFSLPPAGVRQLSLALEMIHTYSLIHDDLPEMDNDDFRRGRPTLHRLSSQSRALLTGDALLTAAFEVSAQSALADDKKISLITHLAQAAGTAGMIGGQDRDLYPSGTPGMENIFQTHRLKSGALLGFAVWSGALLSRRTFSTAQLEALARWGRDLGLLFQIKDDLLDESGSRQELGKSAHKDAQQMKWSAVALLGKKGAEEEMKKLQQKLAKEAEAWLPRTRALQILEFVTQRSF